MLEGLKDIPWHEFFHAYGSAYEVPIWMRQLTSPEKSVRHHAICELEGSICHQGFNCDMTVYVVPFLIELLQEASVQGKEEILELLAHIHEDEITGIEDAPAAVARSFSLYLTLLDDPDIAIRMWDVYLLSSFTERRDEVYSALRARLERGLETREKANLILALEHLLENTNEEKRFLLGLTQNHEPDLVTFAAALILTKIAKMDTPPDIVQFLAEIMMHVPETLGSFIDLPLGGSPEWCARHVLYNLEPQRLEFLVPAVLNRWPEASQDAFSSLEWAEFLLFVLFQGKVGPEKRRAPLSAAHLTSQQRHILELFVTNRSTRQYHNFWQSLKSYGLYFSPALSIRCWINPLSEPDVKFVPGEELTEEPPEELPVDGDLDRQQAASEEKNALADHEAP